MHMLIRCEEIHHGKLHLGQILAHRIYLGLETVEASIYSLILSGLALVNVLNNLARGARDVLPEAIGDTSNVLAKTAINAHNLAPETFDGAIGVLPEAIGDTSNVLAKTAINAHNLAPETFDGAIGVLPEAVGNRREVLLG
jgi:hypothetical protein